MAMCGEYEEIKAVVAIGSQTRKIEKADEFSDLDIFFICDKPDLMIYSDRYVSRLGNVKMSFIEDTIGGGKERRILLEKYLDVDIIPMTPQDFERLIKDNTLTVLFSRGYDVLFDRWGVTELLSSAEIAPSYFDVISEDEFNNLANDFFFHVVWAKKKILRGELWCAKMCVDGYLKNHLLKIIQLSMVCRKGGAYDVWHDGRMLEKWADRDIVSDLKMCFARYDSGEMWTALAETYKLFARLSEECAEKLGYGYPYGARDFAGEYIK
ncbi:MAG: aminoglycoside 6-adenylyltransferase [Ruminiclostridium sp.]